MLMPMNDILYYTLTLPFLLYSAASHYLHLQSLFILCHVACACGFAKSKGVIADNKYGNGLNCYDWVS